MQIITVHGIRRGNRWYENLPNMKGVIDYNIDIQYFDYGFFSLKQFLSKKEREKIILKFCNFYDNIVNDPVNNPPCIVAHSFGTYIVYQAMKKYDVIRFDKIIFCGSILNSKTDFRSLIANKQFRNLKNDHGELEWFLKYTRLLIDKDCGKAGKIGFRDIPADKKIYITNDQSYKSHSDYFLPLNMEINWINYLTSELSKFDYNKEILKHTIIDRIYDNINFTKEILEVNSIQFSARIDKKGNYFAKYVKKAINQTEKNIDHVFFTTTGDGIHSAEEMDFISYDSQNNKLDFDIINDFNNKKTFKIFLNSPIKPKESLETKWYFCWYNTMNLKYGDTDHWSFSNIRNIEILLNFPFELKRPKIYVINKKRVVEELMPTAKIETDSTCTYTLKYDNINNNDGGVFYYEGLLNKNFHVNYKRNKEHEFFLNGNKNQFTITQASDSEISKIYDIELQIEHSNAASEETLLNRIKMFNEGFMVAKHKKGKIFGYIECVIWNEKKFDTFKEISNFPMHFNINGNSLYIIFLAVEKPFRRNGIAQKLIEEVEVVAKRHSISTIRLVAKDKLVDYYSKFGYKVIKELPHFLENKPYQSVFMEKKI